MAFILLSVPRAAQGLGGGRSAGLSGERPKEPGTAHRSSGVPLPQGSWDPAQGLAPGEESSVQQDMPRPHSLGRGFPLLGEMEPPTLSLGREMGRAEPEGQNQLPASS